MNFLQFGYVSEDLLAEPDAPAALASTPPGIPGTHPHQYFGWVGRQREYPQYYYIV